MNRTQEYIHLKNVLEKIGNNGQHESDPVCKSIARKMAKVYMGATNEEKTAMDLEDHIYFR